MRNLSIPIQCDAPVFKNLHDALARLPIACRHYAPLLALANHAALNAKFWSFVEHGGGVTDEFLAMGEQVKEFAVAVSASCGNALVSTIRVRRDPDGLALCDSFVHREHVYGIVNGFCLVGNDDVGASYGPRGFPRCVVDV